MNEEDPLLADLRTAVDQQLTSAETPYVAETQARLVAAGFSDDEAKTEIALCLGEQMDALVDSGKPFNVKEYRTALAALPLAD